MILFESIAQTLYHSLNECYMFYILLVFSDEELEISNFN